MTDGETIKDRLIAAFEMFEFGVEMMIATPRRRHPDASPEQIELMLEAWLLERPGAEAVMVLAFPSRSKDSDERRRAGAAGFSRCTST